jgi:DNA polymerase III subunit beta
MERLVLSTSTAEVGESRVELPVPYEGEAMTISLDNRFVGDFLKVLPPESNFSFDIKGSDQAVYCFTEDNYRYVIMPLSNNR